MKQKEIKASGILLFRWNRQNDREFLLMQHSDRWDLPKGHVDPDETLLEAAFREVREETGLTPEKYRLIFDYKYSETYLPTYPDVKEGEVKKTLTIFVAMLKAEFNNFKITLTEHIGYQWFLWDPPHSIQAQTIDLLLEDIHQKQILLD